MISLFSAFLPSGVPGKANILAGYYSGPGYHLWGRVSMSAMVRVSALDPWLGVERVGVPLAESSYFATFADSSCCVALSASVLALSAKKIQKVTIKFALFQQVQLF